MLGELLWCICFIYVYISLIKAMPICAILKNEVVRKIVIDSLADTCNCIYNLLQLFHKM